LSRDGNDCAPELSKTVEAADALDINGGVEDHGYHVRPSRPLRHSTHCTPASGGEGYSHAPELPATIEAAGALDTNARAVGNVAGLWSRDGNDRAPELSGIVQAAGTLDINGGVEGHDYHAQQAWPLGHSTHCTPASGGDSEMRIMV
jgi:hypothetical protein